MLGGCRHGQTVPAGPSLLDTGLQTAGRGEAPGRAPSIPQTRALAGASSFRRAGGLLGRSRRCCGRRACFCFRSSVCPQMGACSRRPASGRPSSTVSRGACAGPLRRIRFKGQGLCFLALRPRGPPDACPPSRCQQFPRRSPQPRARAADFAAELRPAFVAETPRGG